MSLEQLAFGSAFVQPIEGLTWPPLVKELGFGPKFNEFVDGVACGRSVKQLTLWGRLNQRKGRIASVLAAPQVGELFLPADWRRQVAAIA